MANDHHHWEVALCVFSDESDELSNIIFVFQAFINKELKEILTIFLICPTSSEKHIKPVFLL